MGVEHPSIGLSALNHITNPLIPDIMKYELRIMNCELCVT